VEGGTARPPRPARRDSPTISSTALARRGLRPGAALIGRPLRGRQARGSMTRRLGHFAAAPRRPAFRHSEWPPGHCLQPGEFNRSLLAHSRPLSLSSSSSESLSADIKSAG